MRRALIQQLDFSKYPAPMKSTITLKNARHVLRISAFQVALSAAGPGRVPPPRRNDEDVLEEEEEEGGGVVRLGHPD